MGVRDFFLDKGSEVLGRKVYSFRTKGIGITLILTAVVGFLGHLWPDPQVPLMPWDKIFEALGAGLAMFGVGHKIEKGREENRILTGKVLESHAELATKISQAVSPTPPYTGGTQEPIYKTAKEIIPGNSGSNPGPPHGSGGFNPRGI